MRGREERVRVAGWEMEVFSEKLRKNLADKKKFLPLRSQTGKTVKAAS